MQFQGIKGAISSVLGLIFAPTVIVLMIYQVYEHFQYLTVVRHLIQGLAAAAADFCSPQASKCFVLY
jgi:chromate transporter